MNVDTYLTRTYPNGRVIRYFTRLVRDACCVLNRGKWVKRRNTESRRHNKCECLLCARPSVSTPRSPRTISNRRETYLGEGSEYGHVVFEASEECPLHAIDGDGAHMCSPFVEPRGDQSSSCGVTFAEQCRHHGIGERLCVRFGEVERRTRQGGAGKAMVVNEGNGKFQELSSAILGVENIG